MITESVFLGSDNEVIIIVKSLDVDANGVPLLDVDGNHTFTAVDFITSGVTAMELYINGVTVTSSTSRLNYFDGGKITLKLGDVTGIENQRVYDISVKVFDPLHPNGQVIVHPKMTSSVQVDVVASEIYY